MDCKDLMVGDYIRLDGDVVQVQQIGYKGYDYIIFADNDSYSIDCIEPIPLTVEILVKNGFYRSPRWHYCDITTDDGFRINVQLCGGGKIDYVRITNHANSIMERDIDVKVPISYVHQLQHLLRLVGIEKEITI